MLKTLRDPTFSHLFAAQIVALLGTGLSTVALGLLACNWQATMLEQFWERHWRSRWWPMRRWPIAGAVAERLRR